MEPEKRHEDPRSLSLLEVWIFVALSAIALLGFMSTLSTGDVQEVASPKYSEATSHAREKLEALKAMPFSSRVAAGRESVGGGEYLRDWLVEPITDTDARNRLARIAVTVSWGGEGSQPQRVTLETLRAE